MLWGADVSPTLTPPSRCQHPCSRALDTRGCIPHRAVQWFVGEQQGSSTPRATARVRRRHAHPRWLLRWQSFLGVDQSGPVSRPDPRGARRHAVHGDPHRQPAATGHHHLAVEGVRAQRPDRPRPSRCSRILPASAWTCSAAAVTSRRRSTPTTSSASSGSSCAAFSSRALGLEARPGPHLHLAHPARRSV
jgi:hypothetical protein